MEVRELKRNLMIVVLLSVLFVVGTATVTKSSSAGRAAQNQGFSDSQIEQAEIGLALSPVPLSQIGIGRGRILVGLGSYLVNTGGCNDCHTNPSYLDGHDPFKGQPEQINAAGFLGGGQTFGPFTSRNLTPDPDEGNLPAGLTLDQFVLVIRTGIDLDKAHPQMGPLLQVMPWPTFGKKTDQELEAIYAYLLHIPHVETAKPKT
jgi:hypothetical protein